MTLRAATLTLACVLSACGKVERAETKQTSAAFDLEDVAPFLSLVADRIESGFDDADAAKLAQDIAALPQDGELSREYGVTYNGASMPLTVTVHMDDINAPDVAFRAPAPLTDIIDTTLRRYFESQDP